jgi:hypothetical protein
MKNLILIISIIKPPNKPLSYTSTRSIYTPRERFEQTKKTFDTVRQQIPDSKIFLVECSELTDEEEQYFISKSDYFLNLYNNEHAKTNIYSKSKSLGEGTMTYHVLENIISNKIEFENLIKISGRYWLSDLFDYSKFDNNNITIKYINNKDDNVLTSLYKLPKNNAIHLFNFLGNNFEKMHQCIGYEVIFAEFIKNENSIINCINPIGVMGFISVSNDFYNG